MNAIKQATHVKTETDVTFTNYVYLPDEYDADSNTDWPAIFFLHGKDEIGKVFDTLPDGGLHSFVEQNNLPFVILEPQCPAESEWVFQLDALMTYLEKMVDQYRIDTNRIYLTGLSMGAIGAWHLAIRYPSAFAAILPICGGTYPFLGYPDAVTRIKDVPVWAFHGKDDAVLPLQLTKILVDTLIQNGGNVKYTYYENTGHDAWTRTYSNMDIYHWLLHQEKKTNEK